MNNPPDFEILEIRHNRNSHLFSKKTLEMMRSQIAEMDDVEDKESLKTQLEGIQERGIWLQCWFKDPIARHEEEINALCLLKDAETGLKFAESQLASARFAVIVEKWSREESISQESFRNLRIPLANAIHGAILEHLYPSGLSLDFFTQLSAV